MWFENRRVIDILRSIESNALRLRETRHVVLTTEIDAASPSISLPMERPLYAPLTKALIDSNSVEPGQDGFDAATLFEQVYVDAARLSDGVRRSLRQRSQVGLVELLREQPLEQGLAELVTYMSLSDTTFCVVFDESPESKRAGTTRTAGSEPPHCRGLPSRGLSGSRRLRKSSRPNGARS